VTGSHTYCCTPPPVLTIWWCMERRAQAALAEFMLLFSTPSSKWQHIRLTPHANGRPEQRQRHGGEDLKFVLCARRPVSVNRSDSERPKPPGRGCAEMASCRQSQSRSHAACRGLPFLAVAMSQNTLTECHLPPAPKPHLAPEPAPKRGGRLGKAKTRASINIPAGHPYEETTRTHR
jgi:hypothetical protein